MLSKYTGTPTWWIFSSRRNCPLIKGFPLLRGSSVHWWRLMLMLSPMKLVSVLINVTHPFLLVQTYQYEILWAFPLQAEQVRDMNRELEYMREEVEGNKERAETMPNFCPKNSELCQENDCRSLKIQTTAYPCINSFSFPN